MAIESLGTVDSCVLAVFCEKKAFSPAKKRVGRKMQGVA
jgi:hypothetical protein